MKNPGEIFPLYSQKEFESAKCNDLLTLECKQCKIKFYKPKKKIVEFLKHKNFIMSFCSRKCSVDHHKLNFLKVHCKQCGKEIFKALNIQKRNNGNCFCSHSCTAKYNKPRKHLKYQYKQKQICDQCGKEYIKSKRSQYCAIYRKCKHTFCSHSCKGFYIMSHRETGYSVSKLEKWLMTVLPPEFPYFEFHFNRRDAINSELDIYIPTIKLAFELNGIFHYEPIFSKEHLKYVKNNDMRKAQACLEKNIELCTIDVTTISRFSEKKGQKFFDIIKGVIRYKELLIEKSLDG